MFTGIVTAIGDVVRIEDGRLQVSSPLLRDAEDGASVAVDGVCLTVTSREGETCTFDLSTETLHRTALGALGRGDRVNLERPLRAGDELGGHIVQGHVDGVGRIRSVELSGDGRVVTIDAPPHLHRYLVEKGSVTVDGVSLTISALDDHGFTVAVIPHTLRVTTLGGRAPGDPVNLEVDVLAKHVERLTRPWAAAGGGPTEGHP